MNIVLYGNCQLVALHHAYNCFVTPHTRDTLTLINPRAKLTPAEHQHFQQADLVIDQVTDHEWPAAFDVSTVSARRIRVPAVGTPFLWPWTGTPHPQSVERYAGYHPFRAEMNDTWILRAMKAGASPEQAVADYIALDAPAAGHVDRRYEIEMDRQRTRDAATGFNAAPIIEAHFRTEHLFLTPYHFGLRLGRYMAETTFEAVGVPSHCMDRMRRHMTTGFALPFELPVHPAIARHFNLTWAGEHTRYRFFQEGLLTFAQYVARVANCEAYPELADAIVAANRQAPGAAEQMQAQYERVANAPYPSPWAHRAMGVVRMNQNRLEEAERLLRAALAEHEDNAFWGSLAECLRRADRLPEAVDAMSREAARMAYHAPTRFTFALLLARAGRPADAIREVEMAIELAPGAQQYRVFRDKMETESRKAVLS